MFTKPGEASAPAHAASAVPEIAAQSVREQLAKILAGDAFTDSERMRRFLLLVVEEKPKNSPGRLKEFVIGVEVFDKKPPYDPRLDPIVRVEARRLRVKLREYYETQGRIDNILIDLPKGSYSPTFSLRSASAAPIAPEPRSAGRSIAPSTSWH